MSLIVQISDLDILNITQLCDQILEMSSYRSELYDYLKNRMMAIAPNLTIMVGELVGARLIAHAGSLLNLAKHPSSTVQILGAEKALFRSVLSEYLAPPLPPPRRRGGVYTPRLVQCSPVMAKLHLTPRPHPMLLVLLQSLSTFNAASTPSVLVHIQCCQCSFSPCPHSMLLVLLQSLSTSNAASAPSVLVHIQCCQCSFSPCPHSMLLVLLQSSSTSNAASAPSVLVHIQCC